MSTKIIYRNELGSIVTLQQQSSLANYEKLTYVENKVKIIEIFTQGTLVNSKTINYFLEASENKNTILQQYTDEVNNISCVLYSNKQTKNGFDLWDWESYSKDAELTFKGKEVYDIAHRLIFSCCVDLISNELLDGSWKNYYGNRFENEFDDQLLQVTYKSSGDIDLIFDIHENFGYIKGISLVDFLADEQFSQNDFPWNQHLYYHSAYPFLPDGNL